MSMPKGLNPIFKKRKKHERMGVELVSLQRRRLETTKKTKK